LTSIGIVIAPVICEQPRKILEKLGTLSRPSKVSESATHESVEYWWCNALWGKATDGIKGFGNTTPVGLFLAIR
jgi:hypothetical protein